MGVWLLLLYALVFSTRFSLALVLDLTTSNLSGTLVQHDFVLVNFYASWCRFSQTLEPIFNETSAIVAKEFKSNQVVLARVDCDAQPELCLGFAVTKYPTLRLFKFGQKYHSEYRNQRSTKAFVNYLREQMANPMKNLTSVKDLDRKSTTNTMIGLFPAFKPDDVVYDNFRKLAHLVNDCTFYRVQDKMANASVIQFLPKKPSRGHTNEEQLTPFDDVVPVMPNSTTDFEALHSWATERCTPFVRELTFLNAEEITEPRLPLLVLFYQPHDSSVSQRFTTLVEQHFRDFKNRVFFLLANGEVFSHPLMHMGKTVSDLPVMAIDSFQHMFLYPGDLNEALMDPKHIRKFLDDLASEKLHRRFHGLAETQFKTDPPKPKPAKQPIMSSSIFKLLAPSTNRYSLIKDEL